jgi:type VI secretion system ImpM family protein
VSNWSPDSSNLLAGGAFVGAFGKIPHMGDFVRVRANAEPVTSFHSWIEQGMAYGDAKRGQAWSQVYSAGQIHAFMYRVPRTAKSPAVLTGIVKPSNDAVGRKFPLVVFSPVLEKVVAGGPHLMPLALGDFLERATDVVLEAERMTSQQQLEARVSTVSPPQFDQAAHTTREYENWTRMTYVPNAWLAIYGEANSSRPIHAIHTIVEALGPFRGQESPTTPLSIRLPLGVGGGAAAAFWIDIVRRVGRWRTTIPTCFWSFDGQSGTILIQLGDTPASSLAELWSPDAQSDYVCDLTSAASIDRARFLGRIPPHVAQRLDRNDTLVADLLGALAQ